VSGAPRPADVVGQLRSLCGKAVRSLPASGVGLSVASEETRHSLVVAADPASERLEEMQFVLGEGPCVDASASRRPVLVACLGDEGPGRWPAYTSAAQAAGVRAVFAFPLQIGAAQLGVIDFFRTSEGHLSDPELSKAFAMADEAVAILLDGRARRAVPGPGDGHGADREHARRGSRADPGLRVRGEFTNDRRRACRGKSAAAFR
jgi:hypothetical protein